jgi:serine/threonine protein kinase
VPTVLDVGINDDYSYFDIEYVDGKDIKTLFVNEEISDVPKLVTELTTAFDTMHSREYKHNPSSLNLYFIEEVERKLQDALKYEDFKNFYNLHYYSYNGERVLGMSIQHVFDKFKKLFDRVITSECYVHGNPTLENIMYNPETNKITFIDLYEEGIVDSKFSDYSQILQCSNSYYGIRNDSPITVDYNTVESHAVIPDKLIEFNNCFNEYLVNRYSEDELRLIKLFEATQFFRMLPFKCIAGQITNAKYFYVHACYLVNRFI